MAEDRREMILAKILADLGGLGFINVWRNRAPGEPKDPETQAPNYPAVILLDGNEVPGVPVERKAIGQNKLVASTYVLRPQIWVVLLPRDDAANEGVGEELSAFRVAIIKKLGTDVNLWALLGGNGEMEYLGLESDLQSGSSIEGQMKLNFAFTYTFNPANL